MPHYLRHAPDEYGKYGGVFGQAMGLNPLRHGLGCAPGPWMPGTCSSCGGALSGDVVVFAVQTSAYEGDTVFEFVAWHPRCDYPRSRPRGIPAGALPGGCLCAIFTLLRAILR